VVLIFESMISKRGIPNFASAVEKKWRKIFEEDRTIFRGCYHTTSFEPWPPK